LLDPRGLSRVPHEYRSVPARSSSFPLDAHSLSNPHEEVLDFCGKPGHCVGIGG
jgi:hypothetical protein